MKNYKLQITKPELTGEAGAIGAGVLIGMILICLMIPLIDGCAGYQRSKPIAGGGIEQHLANGTTNVLRAPDNAKEGSALNSTGGAHKSIKLPPGSTYEKTVTSANGKQTNATVEKITVPVKKLADGSSKLGEDYGCIEEGSTNEAHGVLGPSFPPPEDPAAKLKASFAFWRPVQWAGLAAIIGAGVMWYFTKRWKAPAIIAGCGVFTMILAGVVPGHELLILISLGLVALVFGVYEAQVHHLFSIPGLSKLIPNQTSQTDQTSQTKATSVAATSGGTSATQPAPQPSA